MSADLELTRVVRLWLDEGATTLPDRVLDAVLDQLPATSQRRHFWQAWRTSIVNTSRLAIAGIAVLVLAVGGIGLYLSRPSSTGPGVTASPPSTTAPTTTTNPPTEVPSTATTSFPVTGILQNQTYVAAAPFPVRIAATFEGDGWSMWAAGVAEDAIATYRNSADPPAGHGLIFAVVPELYSDACENTSDLVDPGLSTADLATALASQAGTESAAPIDVSVDGYEGTYIEYTFTDSTVTCDSLARWPSSQGPRAALQDEKDRVWILDVDGVRLVIDAFSFPGATAADLDLVTRIVEGLDIEPLP